MARFSNFDVVEWVFDWNWGFGKVSIFKWNPLFDAQRERLE